MSFSQAQKIINEHIEHRRLERHENPDRFNIRPTVGESSFRRPLQPEDEADCGIDPNEQVQPEMSKYIHILYLLHILGRARIVLKNSVQEFRCKS